MKKLKSFFTSVKSEKVEIKKFEKMKIQDSSKIIGGESGEEYAEDLDLDFNLLAY
ncbi:hypothetical protein WAF17_07880 [Bernardetia sp. ABR2-2B]|uniref:hypothetical protein n=1 Tax=Bernardetia sp. ABR2-2B TaxID=3127472 RepID=UPI0030CCACAE